jgi:protoheme ferro-lyase
LIFHYIDIFAIVKRLWFDEKGYMYYYNYYYRYHTQKAYSEMSRVETITSRSTQESKEQLSTSFCCTHTFNLSCSPLERDRKVHVLQQAGIKSLVTSPTLPPPPAFTSAPSFSDIQREFQKKERQGPAQRNFPGFHTSNTDQIGLLTVSPQ